MHAEKSWFAPRAWIGSDWADNVLLQADAQGRWCGVFPGSQPGNAQRLSGAVLPGLVNGHGHAFQRAIAGLTERAGQGQDDFWRWRERMYAAALRITPQQLEAIASHLYAELLHAGYTHVCEFHYLHHQADGKPYADPAEMSHALVRAARTVGMGITLLPVLYMRAGFGAAGLNADQRRFASTPESVLDLLERVRAGAGACVTAGVAVHSLRAVDTSAMNELVRAAPPDAALHIHVAEQQQEIEDCLAHHGRRPVEWLLENAPVDARWNLVHATHASRTELAALRQAGASIVLCPTTEANLGDGVFDLPAWLGAGGRWTIGSDSHITRDWQEELRLLEYSQRLERRKRNVAGRAAVSGSTAAALFSAAVEGGAAAAGLPIGGIAPGLRADFMVVDEDSPCLAGIPADHLLDALVFSSPGKAARQVYVAGCQVPAVDTHRAFVAAMRQLWG